MKPTRMARIMNFRFLTWGASLLAVAGGAGAQSATALPPEQLFERLAPSVWVVRTSDSAGKPIATGSAVVVGPGSLITNCHVLARASKVSVARENVSYGATLEHPDAVRDLCLLKVANFTAPAVTVAGTETLKVGSRVYAIGNPRGLETTISDGLLSGIRRSATDELVALQVSVPISPGSSGGGLFDAQGRLIGITTFMLRDAQNVNFALPASWIAEVPARAAAALAARNERKAAITAVAGTEKPFYEYRLRDRTTGNAQTVMYRLERVDGDKLVFNQGDRIEKAGGEVVSMRSAIGGEYELAMPPGGWVPKTPEPGAAWRLQYKNNSFAQPIAMNLSARTAGESTMRIGARELRIVRVEFTGFTERSGGHIPVSAPYTANAWYAPEIGRIVRFDAESKGGTGAARIYVDEVLELVNMRSE
jgi:serine protease Do